MHILSPENYYETKLPKAGQFFLAKAPYLRYISLDHRISMPVAAKSELYLSLDHGRDVLILKGLRDERQKDHPILNLFQAPKGVLLLGAKIVRLLLHWEIKVVKLMILQALLIVLAD